MTNDNKNIFNLDTFTKLIKTFEDSNNFKNYKIPFLLVFHIFSWQKKDIHSIYMS